MQERPLGKITAILSDLGLEVTYAYDDLIFVQHSAFLLQFTDESAMLKLYINTECNPAEANGTASKMILAFDQKKINLIPTGRYTLAQTESETLSLEFTE